MWTKVVSGRLKGLGESCTVPVVLHEDQVPDLHHLWAVSVDEGRRLSPTDVVVVDLGAGTTGPRVPHLPKVVLESEWQQTVGGDPEGTARVS